MEPGEDRLLLRANGIRERLYGFLHGDMVPLAVTLRGANFISVLGATQKVDDAECIVIEARARSGHYVACFDPARGHSLLSMSVIKGPDDTFRTRKHLSDPDPALVRANPNLDPHSPELTLVQYEASLHDVKLKECRGTWYPASATITTRETYGDGHDRTRVDPLTQTIDQEPLKLEGAFGLGPIPDGTPVIFKEEKSRQTFEWRKGKVQPAARPGPDNDD